MPAKLTTVLDSQSSPQWPQRGGECPSALDRASSDGWKDGGEIALSLFPHDLIDPLTLRRVCDGARERPRIALELLHTGTEVFFLKGHLGRIESFNSG